MKRMEPNREIRANDEQSNSGEEILQTDFETLPS